MTRETDLESRPRVFAPPLGPRAHRLVLGGVGATLGVLALYIILAFDVVDWLLISGAVTLFVGILAAQSIPTHLDHTLRRLADRQVLVFPAGSDLDRFRADLERWVVRYAAPGCGIVIAVCVAAGFLAAFPLYWLETRIPFMVASVVGGYIAGCYLGRMALYGALAWLLRRRGCSLNLIPGHPDHVGGWKPIGDFFFLQALIVGIPAAFIAAWLILIPLPRFQQQYAHWQEPYVGLLAVALVLEIAAFLVPLWLFHRLMAAEKRALIHEADALSRRIAAVQAQLATAESGDAGALKERLTHMTARYQAIEDLPEWPLGKRTKRLFGLNNLILLLPMASQYAGLSAGWTSFLQGLLGSVGP